MKKSKLLAMTMVGCLTVGSVSAFAQVQGREGKVDGMERPTMGQKVERTEGEKPEFTGEKVEKTEGERPAFTGEKAEKTDKLAELSSALELAGVDMEAFKELTKEEQATILADAGIELPTTPEKGEKSEKAVEFTSALELAGIDMEAFKELTKEEQATILADAGIELPTTPEKGERAEGMERGEKLALDGEEAPMKAKMQEGRGTKVAPATV